MKRVYLDESGFTGTHLLDPEQPVYTVAAVILDEQEADDLKRRHFGTYQGPELKFSRLKRQLRHLRASNDLLEELLDRRAVKLSAADKRFVLVAKMFDLITEPLLHALGHDAYQDGFLADFASQVYRLLDGRDSATLTRAMQAFVQLCEDPSEAHRQGYIAAMRAFPDDLGELLETVLIRPAEVMDLDVLRVELPEGPLGIVLTCGLVPVINACREVPSRPLHVIYDRSKVMQHSLSLWNWYLSPHLPPRQIPMLDGPVDLPIDAVTQLESSEAHAGLQLADVMSGLTTMLCAAIWTRQPLGDELTRTWGLLLAEKYGGSGHFHAVAASAERQAPGDYGAYLTHLVGAMEDDPNFPVMPRQGRRPQQAGEEQGTAPAQDQTGPPGDQ